MAGPLKVKVVWAEMEFQRCRCWCGGNGRLHVNGFHATKEKFVAMARDLGVW